MAAAPRRPKAQRFAALAIGIVLAALVFAIARAFWSRSSPQYVDLLDVDARRRRALSERLLEPRGLAIPASVFGEQERLNIEPLSESDVRELFAITDDFEYDRDTYYRLRANLRDAVPWPKVGEWKRVTNSDGVREDHEFPRPAPDVFVLAAGDSHTEGVCDNARSWPNRLEAVLSAGSSSRVEVYNTGTSTYSFFNYLGVLKKYAPRKPDVFVTAVYGGNDFLEVLAPAHWYAKTSIPPRPKGYWLELVAAKELSEPAVSQNLNQTLFLREHADERELALRTAIEISDRIRQSCVEQNIEWIAVYLPPALDLGRSQFRELRRAAAEKLALAEDDFHISDRLADAWIAHLRELHVTVIDLRPIFAADSRELYWPDLHISLDGQELVEHSIERAVRDALARRGKG